MENDEDSVVVNSIKVIVTGTFVVVKVEASKVDDEMGNFNVDEIDA